MSVITAAESINQANQVFWDEMCGTVLAKKLGITDFSAQSLAKFDQWFFDFYPFLKKYFNRLALAGNNVLEIGLGYGTISSYLAAQAADYYAVDIAKGPVDLVNTRLAYLNKPQQATIQSCHALKFADNYFDNIVSIGCFHHTGSVEKCIAEAYRVLKPGGQLLFMCYNKHSLRMLRSAPLAIFLNPKNPLVLSPEHAFLFDSNTASEPAPFVELGSRGYYRKICAKFAKIDISYENCDNRWRKYILNNIARILGLNIYVICKKGE